MADEKVSMEKHAEGRRSSIASRILADNETSIASTENAIPFDEKATKSLLRKLDLHLVPFLALLYL
jgi:hypothetical protein